MKATKSDIQDSCEAYLNALFKDAINTQGTPTKTINEILLAKALSYGRAIDEAQEDVKHILNIRSAVSILIKKAATNIKK